MALQTGGVAQFNAVKLVGASAYHLQLSSDATGEKLPAETRSASKLIQLKGIEAGDYFVRISAIDALGLEGFPRLLPVSLRPEMTSEAVTSTPSPATCQY